MTLLLFFRHLASGFIYTVKFHLNIDKILVIYILVLFKMKKTLIGLLENIPNRVHKQRKNGKSFSFHKNLMARLVINKVTSN